VFPELRRAYDDELIEPRYMDPSELDDAEAAPPGRLLERTRARHPPIDDVVEAIVWWGDFTNEQASSTRTEPRTAPRKVGRNEPCPCGSGKKYKRCCGG